MLDNRKGSVLILASLVVVIILTLSGAVVTHGLMERRAYDVTKQRADAFYLAEAAMDDALVYLKTHPGYTGSLPISGLESVQRGSLLIGEYESRVDLVSGAGSPLRRITASGYVPQKAVSTGVLQQTAQVEGVVYVPLIPPSDFFGDAIYSVKEVSFQGTANAVTGDIEYVTELVEHGSPTLNGDQAQNDPVTAQTNFYSFNFQALRELAVAQNNLYIPDSHGDYDRPFPTSFWLTEPDPANGIEGVPNIVYLEGPLVFKGGDTIGGFILVVGNIVNPGVVTTDVDTTGNGTVTVNGCIYTTGEFTYNGGGNNSLKIDGGIWRGDGARLNGNTEITYNAVYMAAIKKFLEENTPPTLKLLSWRQLHLYN